MPTSVTREAVASLRHMREELLNFHETIAKEASNVKSVFEDNQDGLGAHSDSIRELLEELGETTEEGGVPVRKLVRRLERSALIREDIIDKNEYNVGRSR